MEQEVKSLLNTKFWGKKVVYFEETDSTNNVIKEMATEGAEHGMLVIAGSQTAGRGRRGRNWVSESGSGIWMSFLLRPVMDLQNVSMLTLVAALAVRKTVWEETGISGKIKWPNDIVVNGKKVCGILTELSATSDKINHVVVGVGINANTREFPEEISDVATSLFLESKVEINHAGFIAAFGKVFEEYYEQFMITQDLSFLKKEYNENLVNRNNKVKIIDTSMEYTGISQGINELGELLVTDDAGGQHVVRSGEVSVRGIYGYV